MLPPLETKKTLAWNKTKKQLMGMGTLLDKNQWLHTNQMREFHTLKQGQVDGNWKKTNNKKLRNKNKKSSERE